MKTNTNIGGGNVKRRRAEELAALERGSMMPMEGGERAGMNGGMPGGMPGMGGMPNTANAGPRPTMGLSGMHVPGGMPGGMPGMGGMAGMGGMPGALNMPGMGGVPGMGGMNGMASVGRGLAPAVLGRPSPNLLNPSQAGLIPSAYDPANPDAFSGSAIPGDEASLLREGIRQSRDGRSSSPDTQDASFPAPSVITPSRVVEAMATLREYQAGKQRLEARIVENDKWWRMRHGETVQGESAAPPVRSAWLVNSILNKHADAMDNFPEASVLPREEGDKDAAKVLGQVLPVILEQNGFDGVWSDAWYNKLQFGAAVYGVFWNQRKLNGLGDVEIRNADLLNLFWEPGVRDIQMSRNLFHVEKLPNETLEGLYPKLRGRLTGSGFRLSEYDRDDPADDHKSSLVVDWYYKTLQNGREVLHFCKLCAGEVLYCSEDDPGARDTGFYAHGKYPFVVDVLFPVKEGPAGFGYIDLMKDTQERIDALAAGIVKNARMRATKRFFIRTSGSVNEKEFADWNRELVHTEGALDESSVREITVAPMGADVMNAYQALIEELKETSGNRDFSQGGTNGGVTAASAIAALQEAGSKLSRDMLKGAYRAFTHVCNLALEVIRQFYDLPRTFRIVSKGGEGYVTFDNGAMLTSSQGSDFGTEMGQRLPVFDILVRPQKSNPYSKVAQNEMAMEFYRMGFFNPQMADQALSCMEMMDFDGKDQLMARVSEAGGMQKQVEQMQQQMLQLAMAIKGMQAGAMESGIGPGAGPGGLGGLGGPGGPMGGGPGGGSGGMMGALGGPGGIAGGAPGAANAGPRPTLSAGGMPGGGSMIPGPAGMMPGGMPGGAALPAGLAGDLEDKHQKNPPKQKGRDIDLQAGGLKTIQPAQDIAQKARMRAAQRSNPMG